LLPRGAKVVDLPSVSVPQLVPLKPAAQRRFGELKGKLVLVARFNDPLPEAEQARWSLR